jgi:hypothetical protein
MRTQEEIVDRINEIQHHDLLGFEVDMYYGFLDYEHAKEFLNDGVTREEWDEHIETRQIHDIMKEYMEFAKRKANNQRGISASRSIAHYIAWLWLANDNDLWNEIGDYDNYGIPQLRKICNYLNIEYDGV